jgi:colanic acid biosynthesis glycosyl transferase WcaI
MIHGSRILIIGINYAPELTGIGRYTGEMGAWLAKQQADVQVVTGFPYYPEWKVSEGYRARWFSAEILDGAKVLRCPLYVPGHPSPLRRMMQDLSFFFSAMLAVSFLLLSGKRFDHIWVASPSFLSGWVGLWAGLFCPKANRRLHVFDLQVDAASGLNMIRGQGFIRFLSIMESSMMKKYDIVSTLSEGMRGMIARKKVRPEAIVLLPIWVDTMRFLPMDVDLNLLMRLGISPDKRLVLYSGAVGEKQGLENLLVLAGLAKKHGRNDLTFVIAGDGPFARKLRSEALRAGLDNVKFIALQEDNIFPYFLNSAWLHLILQRDTGNEHFMPSKLYPILSVGGLAMVTAKLDSSLGRLISEHQIGALVVENHPVSMYQMMMELLSEEEKCRTLKTNARNYALKHLSRDLLLNRYW